MISYKNHLDLSKITAPKLSKNKKRKKNSIKFIANVIETNLHMINRSKE